MTRSTEAVVLEAGPDKQVGLTLRYSARARRISLRLDKSSGGAVLVIPHGASREQALAFARSKLDWLDRHLTRLPARQPIRPGTTLPVRGAPVLIRHDSRWPRMPALVDGQLRVGGPEDMVSRRLGRWLKEQAGYDLAKPVDRYAEALGVQVARISIQDKRRQWGSARRVRNLSFSWRLILAPSFVLDYLAAHEVAHLREMNHSPRFWALVDGVCRHRQQAEAWLSRHGPGLYAYHLDDASDRS